MQHALELLAQARRLLSAGSQAPTQADLRRSVSASYYAVFHLLVAAATDHVGQAAAPALRFRIMRAFGHREMRSACVELSKVTGATAPKMFRGLVSGPPHPDLALIADAFVELQLARHEADYDLETPLTVPDARAFLGLAESCLAVWPSIQPLPETTAFLAALLLGDRWTRRG